MSHANLQIEKAVESINVEALQEAKNKEARETRQSTEQMHDMIEQV